MLPTQTVTEADYEKQSTFAFKKGTKVRVTKAYTKMIEMLERFHDEHIADADNEWRTAAQDALVEKEAFLNAVGQEFTVEEYTIGHNPHGVRLGTRLLFFPTECLEEVK